MSVSFFVTKDYENICPFGVKKKQSQSKPIFKAEVRNQKTEIRREFGPLFAARGY